LNFDLNRIRRRSLVRKVVATTARFTHGFHHHTIDEQFFPKLQNRPSSLSYRNVDPRLCIPPS
jgi:hypothetical protein